MKKSLFLSKLFLILSSVNCPDLKIRSFDTDQQIKEISKIPLNGTEKNCFTLLGIRMVLCVPLLRYLSER